MASSWYVVHIATPLNEAPVLRALKDSKRDIEWYYPKFQGSKHLKKKVRPVLRPVFSTYAFVRCEFDPGLAKTLEEVQGCYFVPSASKSASDNILPLEDDEMEQFKINIKEYTTSGTVAGKKVQQNTQVEIISGCLAGYNATVKAIIKDTVIAEIDMFGRTVPLTLKQSEISAL